MLNATHTARFTSALRRPITSPVDRVAWPLTLLLACGGEFHQDAEGQVLRTASEGNLIAVDPTDHRNVWVGLEVDGVRQSRDGGETWRAVNGAIPNPDVHNVLVVAGPPKTVFTVVNDDIWRSTDDGQTWQPARAREVFPWHYPRGIAVRPDDPRTVFVTLGDATPGRIGTVMRSRDAGATWETLALLT